jgi:beta-glucosidase/6-phospho-beta-glucosidase/beta-galactosidase
MLVESVLRKNPACLPVWLAAALSLWTLACNGQDKGLPRDFLFGTSINGFQADMGCPNMPGPDCVHSIVDWYEFATSPEMISSGGTYLSGQDPSEVGPGHWELYEQDLDLAADRLSNNAFKTTIEWGRLFPRHTDGINGYEGLLVRADPQALEHYHALLTAMRSRGLEPMVALNQATLPAWLHDAVGCNESVAGCLNQGWVDRVRIVHEISKYAGFVAREFGSKVDLWITISSPYQVMFSGYIWPSEERVNPPAVYLEVEEARTVFAAMAEAHASMYDALKAGDSIDANGDGQASQIGLAYAVAPAYPMDPDDPHDVTAAENTHYLWNQLFLNAFVRGEFDHDFDGEAYYRADLDGHMDFIGINYWADIRIVGSPYPSFPELSPLTTFDPLAFGADYSNHEGIYDAIMYLHRDFGLPIIVSESGTIDQLDDGTTPEVIVGRFKWILRAIEDGADVRGHFFYSLIDSYEWNLGMLRHHGLFAVDENDPEKKRTGRKGVDVYAQIAGSGGIPAELAELYQVD